jgi:replicative DNA helicase
MNQIDANDFLQQNMSRVNHAILRAHDRLAQIKRGDVGFTSGIRTLDEHFRLMPGELTAIGARSSTGKTAIGMQVVRKVLRDLDKSGKPGVVCVFTAEMGGDNLMIREACALEGIPLWKLNTRQATDTEFARISERLNKLDYDRLFLDESSAPTLEHMLTQLEIIQEEYGKIAFVLFDYTELSGELEKMESQRIAKISRGLKFIAKRYDCPVLTLSQLNRDIESRSDKTPTMRDMMHGGEREPDCIVILVRPWLYDKAEPRELVYGYTVKNRNGPIGNCVLFFQEEIMRFKSADIIRKELDDE